MQQEHYEVIARKWRPQSFDDLIGQEHITETLKNEIQSGRIAQAFLFRGIRGIGKTSAARILAKALNCRQSEAPTADPCNRCDACLSIKNGNAADVMEIDGASNRKIEHIRELRENIKFAPATLRYKVYIIDEVHMLTREAFNALLKTLEEPPKHVVFVLATTDDHKVPITISSRCQRFSFRRIGLHDMSLALHKIAESEGIQIDDQSLLYIAKRSEGSMRDAQSLLEQVISYCGTEVSPEKVSEILGVVSSESIQELTAAILADDPETILHVIHSLVRQGHDLEQFYKDILEYIRNLLVLKISPKAERLLDNATMGLEVMRRQSDSHSLQELRTIFKYLLHAEADIKRSASSRFSMEMALLQACRINSLESFDDVWQQVQRLGEQFSVFEHCLPQELSVCDETTVEPHFRTTIPSMSLEELAETACEIFEGHVLS
ncbi:DNA polymerase III subunit gamma/tau [candidate division KSB3 bacterium]|uniref:DNA polymerase III subunit gamma/tau n=1 Tax=candidate division KSB3 bacterium TaxID=2044937 RepID=A0A2G6E4J8_9BACT|nr:MAG: DNA polymerase III subunit gamma/tau [candidate division KSB3 bacterium]PIE29130.1 MAG: DNA polymerase III subunit gamma/tau [candidate division KSB3 bacterium]